MQTDYTYEGFGRTTATGSVNSNSYQYTGRENDGTGLYYYRARYYSATLQRFITEDPTGFELGATHYSYVNSNPLAYIDPLGLDAVYVNFNFYWVNTGYGFSAPFGHAGVLTIDPRTGATRYYEYGRYNGQACGEVVRRPAVPDVKIGKNGVPTQESLARVYDFLSTNYGQGKSVSATYYRDTNFDSANNNAERTKNDRNRPCYDFINNNCKTFAHRIASGG